MGYMGIFSSLSAKKNSAWTELFLARALVERRSILSISLPETHHNEPTPGKSDDVPFSYCS